MYTQKTRTEKQYNFHAVNHRWAKFKHQATGRTLADILSPVK